MDEELEQEPEWDDREEFERDQLVGDSESDDHLDETPLGHEIEESGELYE